MAQAVRNELAELYKRAAVLKQILEEYDRGNPESTETKSANVA